MNPSPENASVPFTKRFLAALATWTMLVLATPGAITEAGSAALACIAIVPWGLVCSRPGKKAFLAEFLAAFLGMTGLCWWINYVWAGALLTVGVMPAVWVAVAGVFLRRMAERAPLGVAVALAWTLGDTLRHTIEPPFSFGWMRHGLHWHDWPIVAGSARVWGIGGLGFVSACISGGICSAWECHGRMRVERLLWGLVPLGFAVFLSFTSHPPETKPGPSLLLVQPGIEQARKQSSTPSENLWASLRATQSALANSEDVDLICWGETMLAAVLFEDGIEDRLQRGEVESPPWVEPPFDPAEIREVRRSTDALLQTAFFARSELPGIIPEGTSFLSGAQYYLVRDDWVRRSNSVFLWNENGERSGPAMKRHLVPGGETMLGLERYAWVRDTAFAVANYIPDLVAGEETGLLELTARDGERYAFSASVCFDNLYDDVYTDPLAAGETVDFHLVASNEAWFKESWEMDQMMAFSKLIAIFTGRSFVRVTNSGITSLIGPDGVEKARFRDAEGRDRAIEGALRVVVDVPSGRAEDVPLFVHSRRVWIALWLLLPIGLAIFPRKRSVTPEADPARPGQTASPG